jgi:UDP-glucose 4-epimerase
MKQDRSCIVLGGGGFIGTNLCRRLVQLGWHVRAFGRRHAFPESINGVEWYQGDLTDVTTLANAIQSSDAIFHLANATTPLSANLDMAADVQKNVLPTLALLDLASKTPLGRIIFASSGGTIYGRPSQIPTPETSPTDPITAYAVSKLATEKYLALHEILHATQYRILRMSNPFGPFQTPAKNQGLISALISRGIHDEEIEIWGDGSIVRDFIFIDDVVDAFLAAVDDQSNERIFNIGSGEGQSIREVIAEIERHIGALRIRWKPGRAIDLPVSILAIDRARHALNWTPKTSFQEGMEQTVAWWRGLSSPVHP